MFKDRQCLPGHTSVADIITQPDRKLITRDMMQESDSDGAVLKLSANIKNKCNENVASMRQDVQ